MPVCGVNQSTQPVDACSTQKFKENIKKACAEAEKALKFAVGGALTLGGAIGNPAELEKVAMEFNPANPDGLYDSGIVGALARFTEKHLQVWIKSQETQAAIKNGNPVPKGSTVDTLDTTVTTKPDRTKGDKGR